MIKDDGKLGWKDWYWGVPVVHVYLQCCCTDGPGCCDMQLDAAVASLAEQEVPMKRLLLLVDLARQGVPDGQHIPLQRWIQVLTDLSLS